MIQVFLDGQDITASLNAQYPLPQALSSGVFPSKKAGEWYDLMQCIDDNAFLAKNFFNGGDYGVHEFKIVNTDGQTFQARLLTRMKYTARNS